MAAPASRLRGSLSMPGLVKTLRRVFASVPDARRQASVLIPMVDALGAAFAMFSLKFPSMLEFDTEARADPRLVHNLKALFGLARVPSDSGMREILDTVPHQALRPAFEALHRELQRAKVLEPFATLFDGAYLLAMDGTGHYCSSKISCPQCCVKERSNGEKEFYHQSLNAVIVHPDIKGVALPLAIEPITRDDGTNKNDCERNAGKRLIDYVAGAWPQRRFIAVEDALASNGPHIELLLEKGMDFILGVKPGGNEALFEEVSRRQSAGTLVEWTPRPAEDGSEQGYRFANGCSLNKSHPDIEVNFLEWWEVGKRTPAKPGKRGRPGKPAVEGKYQLFTWATSLEITVENVFEIMRAARARWKIENELFNVIKNQGYEFEHSYGHGKLHLSSTLAAMMMIAFLVDQIQERACRVYQKVRLRRRTKAGLWLQMRAMMLAWRMPDWATMFELMIDPDRVLMKAESG